MRAFPDVQVLTKLRCGCGSVVQKVGKNQYLCRDGHFHNETAATQEDPEERARKAWLKASKPRRSR